MQKRNVKKEKKGKEMKLAERNQDEKNPLGF
jgi:hypothetical protein